MNFNSTYLRLFTSTHSLSCFVIVLSVLFFGQSIGKYTFVEITQNVQRENHATSECDIDIDYESEIEDHEEEQDNTYKNICGIDFGKVEILSLLAQASLLSDHLDHYDDPQPPPEV